MNRNNNSTYIPGIPSSGIRGTPGYSAPARGGTKIASLAPKQIPSYLGGLGPQQAESEPEEEMIDFKYIVRELPPVKVVRGFLRTQLESDSESSDPY